MCSCDSNKGTWKVYASNGMLVKAYGSTDGDKAKAQSEARKINGSARKG